MRLRLPFVQVANETWEDAGALSKLMTVSEERKLSVGDAFMWICTLYRWGISLGPEGEDPTGVCESPRGVKLMAAAVGCPIDRAEELAGCLEDLGLLECLTGGPVRVRGVRERYEGVTASAEERSEKARKAAEARWNKRGESQGEGRGGAPNAQPMLGASSPHAQPMLGVAKTQTQTQTHRERQLPLSAEKPADPRPDKVFEHWRTVMGKNARTAFDDRRRKAVEKRLSDGYTVEDLCRAIDGCRRTPHNMGANDRKERFDDLELICRDASHVDRFRATAEAAGPPPKARPDADALAEVQGLTRAIAGQTQLPSQLTQLRWARAEAGLVGFTDDPLFAAWMVENYGDELQRLGIAIDAPKGEGVAA